MTRILRSVAPVSRSPGSFDSSIRIARAKAFSGLRSPHLAANPENRCAASHDDEEPSQIHLEMATAWPGSHQVARRMGQSFRDVNGIEDSKWPQIEPRARRESATNQINR